MKVLVIDVDYEFNRAGEPVIRLFGRKTGGIEDEVVVHVKGFEPYFYCECLSEKDILDNVGEYVKRIEKVMKFKPIGYQVNKTEMLMVVLYNPRVTREVRIKLEEIGGLCYEADIYFKNRYMIDNGVNGMSIIEFNEIGKELAGYGLNCNELYIIEKEDIRVLDEIVSIEY